MVPRARPPGCGWARKTKNLSRVREVCARVEDDGGRPYRGRTWRSLRTGAPAANNHGEREHGGSLAQTAPVLTLRLRMRAVGVGTRPRAGTGTRATGVRPPGPGTRAVAPARARACRPTRAGASSRACPRPCRAGCRAAPRRSRRVTSPGSPPRLPPLGAGALDRADGGDDRGRAAGEDLGEGAVLGVAAATASTETRLLGGS